MYWICFPAAYRYVFYTLKESRHHLKLCSFLWTLEVMVTIILVSIVFLNISCTYFWSSKERYRVSEKTVDLISLKISRKLWLSNIIFRDLRTILISLREVNIMGIGNVVESKKLWIRRNSRISVKFFGPKWCFLQFIVASEVQNLAARLSGDTSLRKSDNNACFLGAQKLLPKHHLAY